MSLPLVDVSLSIIKNNFVSCGPNHPTCRDDYFPEYDVVKVCSGLKNHVEGAEVQVPADWNGCPTISTERTLEK